jgi:effector-binding domain-containing protein
MKTVKKILLWILGVIVVLVLGAYLLPKTYKVERSIYIKANSKVIYELASNFSKWHLWVHWTKEIDSTVIFELAGTNGQPGASWKWDGEILGNGIMTATEFQPGKLVTYDLAFDQGKYQSKGQIILEEGDSCKVTWIDEGDLGYNPMNRYMGLFMGKMMGPGFEKGLLKLKRVAEERATWPEIEEVIVPEQTVVLIKDSAGPADYAKVMGKAYTELFAFVRSNKLTQKGYPFATYLKWDSVTMFSVMNIGIPVETATKGNGRITIVTIPEHKAIKAIHFGDYSKTEPVYRAMDQYIKSSEMVETGGPTEIYITSPVTEKDTSKWETHILFPVK